METNKSNYQYDNIIQIEDADLSRKFIANVFLWMFGALAVSAFCAYEFAFNPNLLSLLYDVQTGQRTGLSTILIFAPFIFIMVMRFGMNNLSFGTLALLFGAFAAVLGISLSSIFLVYDPNAILGVFITSSAVFGVMAVAGYTTKQDLTQFGALLIMALVGIVIASFVNMFLHSEGLGMIITYIGVAVFVGLTAYDVQKLKRIGAAVEYGAAEKSKLGLMGALTLYLDFINLFLMLLRLFGGGRRR